MLIIARSAWQPTFDFSFCIYRTNPVLLSYFIFVLEMTYSLCMYWSSRSVFKEQSYLRCFVQRINDFITEVL